MAADAPVRVIDAFVDGLDVNGLGFGGGANRHPSRESHNTLIISWKFRKLASEALLDPP